MLIWQWIQREILHRFQYVVVYIVLVNMLFTTFGLVALLKFLSTTVAQDGSTDKPPVTAELPNNRHINGILDKGMEEFLGIPYAEPPTGKNRLKNPVQYKGNLDGYRAINHRADCVGMNVVEDVTGLFNILPTAVINILKQIPLFRSQSSLLGASEDCLHLNVYRPAGTNSQSQLPVMVYFFGGGFETGTPRVYDPVNLMREAKNMAKPFIYVSINYRLGAYGWLAGKEVASQNIENLGLKDQRLALQWVADNIDGFGGDSNNVNLYGESAGAISIWWHHLWKAGNNIYKGRPLFHGAIMSSGGTFNTDFVKSEPAQSVFDTVVKAGGCQSADDKLDCLRKLPSEKFEDAQNALPSLYSYRSIALSFCPRPDGKIIPTYSGQMTKAGLFTKSPFIMSSQEDEGTLFSLFAANVTTSPKFDKYVAELFPALNSDGKAKLEYLYPDDPTQNSPYRTRGSFFSVHTKRIAALLGDIWFQWPRRDVLNSAVAYGVTAWSMQSRELHGLPALGTFHFFDIVSAFFIPGNLLFPSRFYRRHFITFLYHKDPNPDSGLPEWPQYGKDLQQVALDRNKATVQTDDYRKDSYEYITKNFKKFLL